MDPASVTTAIAAAAILAAAGIAIVVLNLRRSGQINETPNELQFGDRKYIPPDGYVDRNVVKAGKTRTLKAFYAEGSMSWGDFFDPKDGQEEKRAVATYMLIGFFVIAGLVTVAMSYLGVTWGYYFGLLIMGYATLIVSYNYVKARRGYRRPPSVKVTDY